MSQPLSLSSAWTALSHISTTTDQCPVAFHPDRCRRGVTRNGRCQRIAAGTVIETAPVVPYRTECGRDEMPDRSLPPELADLPHDWDEEHGCLVFGAMQFANHSDAPNAKFTRNIEALTMTFTALRDIEAGEEITIDYGIAVWWE